VFSGVQGAMAGAPLKGIDVKLERIPAVAVLLEQQTAPERQISASGPKATTP